MMFVELQLSNSKAVGTGSPTNIQENSTVRKDFFAVIAPKMSSSTLAYTKEVHYG